MWTTGETEIRHKANNVDTAFIEGTMLSGGYLTSVQVSDDVAEMLTKDYSALMKKIDEKKEFQGARKRRIRV